jgi:hypothetical protein
MPDRSAKVGSLRERAHPGCDCDRCTPARSTARACAIPWVDGFAMELVVREPAPGEFRGVRAPDHDRPGTAQVGDRRAVFLGNQVSESGNAIRGRTAFLIGVDLGGDGNASSGPVGPFFARSRSAASARVNASSASVSTTAFTRGLTDCSRARHAATASLLDTARVRIACANRAASHCHSSSVMQISPTSGPIPKFASARVTFRCELRNLRTTSNFMILVRF